MPGRIERLHMEINYLQLFPPEFRCGEKDRLSHDRPALITLRDMEKAGKVGRTSGCSMACSDGSHSCSDILVLIPSNGTARHPRPEHVFPNVFQLHRGSCSLRVRRSKSIVSAVALEHASRGEGGLLDLGRNGWQGRPAGSFRCPSQTTVVASSDEVMNRVRGFPATSARNVSSIRSRPGCPISCTCSVRWKKLPGLSS